MQAAHLLPLLLAGVAGVAGLFEDQAGTYDWYKPYVGHVTSAAFHKTKPKVYVATEQGVVGALNLRDGSISFRHKLGEDEPAKSQLLEAPALFFSSVGRAVQAWDNTDGALKWSASLPTGKTASHASVILIAPGSSPVVAVLGMGALATFDASTGAKARAVILNEEAASGSIGVLHATDPDSMTAYTYTPGHATVHQITLDGEATLSSPTPLSSVAAVGPAGFLALSQDYSSACIAGSGSEASLQCSPLPSLGLPGLGVSAQAVATAGGWAVASGDPAKPGMVLLRPAAGGGLEAVASFQTASAVSSPFAATAGDLVAAVEVQADGSIKLDYVLTSSGEVVVSEGPIKGARSERLAPGVTAPGVKGAQIGAYKRRDGSQGFRLLLIWQDERITLVQQEVTVWSRDEALGGVTGAIFSDLPPGKELAAGVAEQVGGDKAAVQGWQDKLKQFVQLQLLSVKVQFKLASPEEVKEWTRVRSQLSDKNLPTRDARGFRRALIVATSSGKLAALHNGDGHVLWSRPGPLDRRGKSAAVQHLLPWRAYHDLQHAPQVATLSALQGGGTQLSVLDVYTGREMQATALPYAVDKLIGLGHIADGDHAEQQLYMAVHVPREEGSALRVHLLPDTPLARAHFASKYRSLYFFLDGSLAAAAAGSDGTHAEFRGYGFDAAAAAEAQATGSAAPTSTWALALPEPVLGWAAVDPNEPVYTSVKVLGDRSMKYRYLNPNTMVLVTGSPPATAEAPDAAMDTLATIYVVDTVTGSVRHSQTAPGCRGPAVVMVTENLVLVQLWDAAAARFSVTSMELFDASERTFSVLDNLFNPNATAPQTSFAPPPLEVPSASFFTRTPAKALLTTRTREGITSKLLIALTHTDQVYTLDMRFVDPRRPRSTKLTAEQLEERLIPYADTLPLIPPSFASFNKLVLGIKGAISAPSRLESTSLLFSYGTDLQYTRLAPAKGFDSLDDDFSYGLLIVALIGLSGASAFLHVYTKKSMLKAKWL